MSKKDSSKKRKDPSVETSSTKHEKNKKDSKRKKQLEEDRGMFDDICAFVEEQEREKELITEYYPTSPVYSVTHARAVVKQQQQKIPIPLLPIEIVEVIFDFLLSTHSIQTLLCLRSLTRTCALKFESLSPDERRFPFYEYLRFNYDMLLKTSKAVYLREVNLCWRAIFMELIEEKTRSLLHDHYTKNMTGSYNAEIIASSTFKTWLDECYASMLVQYWNGFQGHALTLLTTSMIQAVYLVSVNNNFKCAISTLNKRFALSDYVVSFVYTLTADQGRYMRFDSKYQTSESCFLALKLIQ